MPRATRSSLKLSQQINNSSQVDIDEFVNNCVRYMLYHSNQVELRKNELTKSVLKNCGKSYDEIINRSKVILKDVYGVNLLIADTGNNNTYYLSSALSDQNDNHKFQDNNENKERILLLLTLTHIFMSGGAVTEMSLYAFLKQLDIETDTDDPIYGNVNVFINQTLIKQKYLQNATDPSTKQVVFKWGMHAELEIDKMKILEFVCMIYGEHQPDDWEEHYEIARKENMQH